MQFRIHEASPIQADADILVVGCFQDEKELPIEVAQIDERLSGAIQMAIAGGDFSGRPGETHLLYSHGALAAPRVLVVGLGEKSKFNPAAVRNAAATSARRARSLGAVTVASLAHGVADGLVAPRLAGQMIVEGVALGLYRFEGYRSRRPADWKVDPVSFAFYLLDPAERAPLQEGVERGEAIALGVIQARDWVNEPANYMTPSVMQQRTLALAEQVGLKVQVLDRAEMGELGMGIFLAVAAESEQPPKFIILEHNAGRTDLPTVVLVGKGVTFDSGGISLKPSADMWEMKRDMAGAAAVIATLGVTARLSLPVHAIALAPCAENLPGGRAQKPGDVYRGMLGKTMEVISTDAEGRMLLADALAYAKRFNAAAVVDIATLTGAQSIALGPLAAACFTPDDALASRLESAARVSDDRVWRMPLYDEYLEAIKSQVADVKNSGSRYGGVGTSAKFLQHFTEGYPWAHVDMASMASADEDKPAQPKGATGYGVRLLTALLETWC